MKSKKQHILVIEDESALRKVLATGIRKQGFVVSEAGDGAEGLALALKKHPDLILLDIVMPVMDGIAMINKLRQDKWGKNALVIVLTNLSDIEREADFMKNGVYNYIIKSDWKMEQIIEKIKKILK